VDGVIVTSSRVGALYLEHLERLGVPVVLVNNHNAGSGRYTFSISVDNHHGGYLATGHLVQLGHRDIAYVSGPVDHSDDRDRLAGYRQALKDGGIPFDPALVVRGDGTADGGERAVPELLSLIERPSAVFCYNDMTAIGLMRSAREADLSIPGDLAVVGFDDIPFASYVSPSLTTVAQLKADMGRWATEMALALIAAKDPVNREFANVEVKGQLITRESTVPATG
jgi:DNA-binding LacI/PurR family transcriptional regulator